MVIIMVICRRQLFFIVFKNQWWNCFFKLAHDITNIRQLDRNLYSNKDDVIFNNLHIFKLFIHTETNLGDAIIQADALLDLQSRFSTDDENILSMMYVLSDGQPTIGITNHDELINAVKSAINGEHSLFALGFGRNVSFDLLIQLALQNQGYARRIYETADASKQLQSFYFEVSRPVIFDVDFEYEPGVSNPDDLTRWRFPFYFEGSEVSVAGKVLDRPTSNVLQSIVTGQTALGQVYRGDNRHDIRVRLQLIFKYYIS